MTDCNAQPLRFSTLGSRDVVADLLGGRLTSDAGALLLREVDRRIGLTDALDKAIPDPRAPEKVVHHQKVMLAQRITAMVVSQSC